MTSPSGIERTRGAKESRQQLEALREKWPLAFPTKPYDIRPLAAQYAISAAGRFARNVSK
jgi:hypothetical protein